MKGIENREAPGFLYGIEVARFDPDGQPGFGAQLQLLRQEPDVKAKLTTATLVIFGVFFLGMLAGAILGIFV
ncbi:MAG: hypothetical protein CVT63_05395 [Candidatus Anoxymicrobium japonicum]|uniref:Uncharacterized protein n=1 Tax=Candidatus Anoxymicrobium japonicum TaxID=2013648 RepID=A0A2N3G5C2_9ACTN|nr:MAG: hypothetical protein CVT63_05395 [Candidatus Anoxymicrobium japonicum]